MSNSSNEDDFSEDASSVTGNNNPPSVSLTTTRKSRTKTKATDDDKKENEDNLEFCAPSLNSSYQGSSGIGINVRGRKKRAIGEVVNLPNKCLAVASSAKEALEHGLMLHGLLQRSQANYGVGNVGLVMLQAQGLASNKMGNGNTKSIDSVFEEKAISTACQKYFADAPPFVHFSAKDSAPVSQLSIGPSCDRLSVTGGMRGYRMTRASHGVDSGTFYYEVVVLPPTKIDVVGVSTAAVSREFYLPASEKLRLGRGLKAEMNESTNVGHLRIGWSMRTGALHAPVGYDKWSYGLRDINGSKIHESRREDNWGGIPFGPGDVIGFAIHLKAPELGGLSLNLPDEEEKIDTKNVEVAKKRKSKKVAARIAKLSNHIRFFKNGKAMGNGFLVSRGVRSG